MARPSLMDCHSKLSELSFAVKLTLEPIPVGIVVEWQEGTYLAVKVECRERDKQQVVDKLNHGALGGGYDYRFSVSYPTGKADPLDWCFVTAYPDIGHDAAKRRRHDHDHNR